MPKPKNLKESYVVWNNKGGTGKTTLVFHLATEYARKNRDTLVVVLDMCPQANISAALLTELDKHGNGRSGENILRLITSQKINRKYEKTICGYLSAKLEKESTNHQHFLTKAYDYNKNITDNVYVLCGDRYLESLSKRIDQERRNDPVSVDENPWKRATLFLKSFVDYICDKNPWKNFMFFIDTNPAFSVYTELAISAGTRLIVPINADTFSKAAVESMFFHVYGIDTTGSEDQRHQLFQKLEYYWKVRQDETKIPVPKLHMIINNRATSYKTRAAAAFAYKAEEVENLLAKIQLEHPGIFSNSSSCIETLSDFHTRAVLCLQTGTPLAEIKGKFVIGDKSVSPGAATANDYVSGLEHIVDKL